MFETGVFFTILVGIVGLVSWYYGPRKLAYKPRISIIWYVIAVNVVRGVLLLFSKEPANITTIHTVVSLDLASVRGIGVLFLSVACLAMQGLFIPGKAAIPFLLPQGMVLLLSAIGAMRAMFLGTYADGVVRTPLFIMADQCPAVIVAFLYWLLLLLLVVEKEPAHA